MSKSTSTSKTGGATRLAHAQQIVDWEARRHPKTGHIGLYPPPSNDGGGAWEYAGINERYHPKALGEIRRLKHAGKHKEAERFAVEYIANYTEAAASWSVLDAIDLYLRDSCFNRGPGGAAKILQRAVRVNADGDVGRKTLEALREWEKRPLLLLARLRVARERYEIAVAGVRDNLWQGLENRWDRAFEASAALLSV